MTIAVPPPSSPVTRRSVTKKPAAQLVLPRPKRAKPQPSLTVSAAIDRLENSSDWAAADLFLCPPGGDNSDGDSEDEGGDSMDKFKSNILLSEATLKIFNNNLEVAEIEDDEDEESDDDYVPPTTASTRSDSALKEEKMAKRPLPAPKPTPPPKGKNKKPRTLRKNLRVWEEGDITNCDLIKDIEDSKTLNNPRFDDDDTEWDPIKLFELFFDDDVLTHITTNSNQYARESNAPTFESITNEEMRCFIAILMVSGYYKVPQYWMMWEEKDDVQNLLVASSMRRARFEQILRYIHFNSNTESEASFGDGDKCAKVRPLLDFINERCQKNALLTKEVNVDESMIPYYGKFGNALKQRMPQKPIRSGYKVWALNLDGGYCYCFCIYQGKHSQNQFTAEFGHGPSVALGLFDKLPKQGTDSTLIRYKLYLDNFFTSLNLADELTKQGHGVTGTINVNMLGNCPLTESSQMKTKARGTSEVFCYSENTIICHWLDNNTVRLLSNCDKAAPVDFCRRWCRERKIFINPPCPKLIKEYNAHMGGTDVMDQAISAYRIAVRNRKWYWPLWTFTIHVSLYNSWLLHRKLINTTTKMTFLSFIREIAQRYLKKYGVTRCKPGKKPNMLHKKSRVASRVNDSVRFDMVGHSLESSGSRSRCAFCSATSATSRCKKCKVMMHSKCFAAFHGL